MSQAGDCYGYRNHTHFCTASYKKPFPTFPHPAQPSDTSMHGQSTSSLNIAKKKLPAVPIPPLGTLGLDLHGASYARSPRQAAVNENDSRRSER